MEGPAKKCVERCCELANKKTEQLHRVSDPCLDDHHVKEEELEISWRISKSMLSDCLQNACIWHELVGLTIFGL